MKKTLAALIVSAFAATAANAATVYDNDGTKVDVGGSLRFVLEKTNAKGKGHSHSGLRNDGSRLSVNVKHNLGDDFYALGRLEVRFDGNKKNTDGFGDLYTKRAYVGLGNKAYGDVTFGRQVTLADDLTTADDYSYGIIDKDVYIPTAGNSVIRYDYKGIDRLQVGVSYQFADSRDSKNNEVSPSTRNANGEITRVIQNGYIIGAVYNKALEEGVIARFAYGRTNYSPVTGETDKLHKDGFLASFGYNFGDADHEAVISLDGGYAKDKIGTSSDKTFYVSPGFRYHVTDMSRVYGNYKYEQVKHEDSSKDKQHGFLLGVDYKLHKQVVTYLEGKYQVTKEYDSNGNYEKGTKKKDKAIGVGMRVYF